MNFWLKLRKRGAQQQHCLRAALPAISTLTPAFLNGQRSNIQSLLCDILSGVKREAGLEGRISTPAWARGARGLQATARTGAATTRSWDRIIVTVVPALGVL